jgi:hypothetical protein
MSLQNQIDENGVLETILHRSTTDRDFRNRLLADPNPAIEEVIGVSLSAMPNNVRVKFIEKDKDVDSLIVLPDLVDVEGSLSDAELEAVAGGGEGCLILSCSFSWTICTISKTNEIEVCTAS